MGGGDGSGSIVSLIGTLVGSSSGGGEAGGAAKGSEDGEEGGGGGSDLQAVLGTVLPIIGSLSGIGNREPPDLSGALQLLPQILASLSGRAEPGEEPLEIGTLLQLAEPLLEGISGGDDDEEEGGEGGGGGSNVGAVLTALTPLVGLLSGVSTGLSGPGGPSVSGDGAYSTRCLLSAMILIILPLHCVSVYATCHANGRE